MKKERYFVVESGHYYPNGACTGSLEDITNIANKENAKIISVMKTHENPTFYEAILERKLDEQTKPI